MTDNNPDNNPDTPERNPDMTSPTYPDLTDYDLLQLIDLDTKANWEGSLRYAVENWTWDFDDPTLDEASRGNDTSTIRAALRATHERREQWWADHPHPTQIAPLEAHEAEVERRAKAVTQ